MKLNTYLTFFTIVVSFIKTASAEKKIIIKNKYRIPVSCLQEDGQANWKSIASVESDKETTITVDQSSNYILQHPHATSLKFKGSFFTQESQDWIINKDGSFDLQSISSAAPANQTGTPPPPPAPTGETGTPPPPPAPTGETGTPPPAPAN